MKLLDCVAKDILTVESGAICQQVNCRGVMGKGLAFDIRKKWPKVYEVFRSDFVSGHAQLGNITVIEVEKNLWVINLFAQREYFPAGQCHTNYQSFLQCLKKVRLWKHDEKRELVEKNSLQIYFPYGIGCGLAGGKWMTVVEIIAEQLPTAILCQKGTV